MSMRRLLILLYGVLAYLAFFVTILYAIGFASNAVVPKAINDGNASSLTGALAADLLLIALFGVTHSTMARPGFKERFKSLLPVACERSTFVLVASLQLALLFWLWQPLPAVVWKVEGGWSFWLLRGISLAGWAMVFWSSFLIDHFDLFGLRQVWLNFKGERYTQRRFVLRGLYRHVRHPLMLGFLIAFWVTPLMTFGHLLFAAAMTLYILIGVTLEERDLSAQLGDDYRTYQTTTAMLFPWTKRKR